MLFSTWPAEAGVSFDPLDTCGSMLAGIRGTLRDVHFTVVPLISCVAAVTFIAARHTDEFLYSRLSKCNSERLTMLLSDSPKKRL